MPQIPPEWYAGLYFPRLTFNLAHWLQERCSGEGVCLCARYASPDATFDIDTYYWGVVPGYIVSRVWNAVASTQWLLAHFLTHNTFVDRGWQSLWELLWPSGPSWIARWFGDQGEAHTGVGIFCIVLHLGSVLYVLLWGVFGRI